MSADTNQEPVARMDVPPEGAACGVIFGVSFVGFFTALAVWHLVAYSQTPVFGLVVSVIWLVMVSLCLGAGVYAAGGWRATAIAGLGAFSARQFVEVRHDGDRTVIGFGFELFRRRFYYLRVERERIIAVTMSTGQATDLARRDMNDWSVALWYDEPNPRPPRRVEGARTDEVYIVGPPGAKAPTAEFFAQFVAFLRAAGVDLHPSEKDTEFRVGVP